MTPRNSSSSQSPALAVTEVAKIPEVVEDKYAALKDLDEIFKNTVVVTDGKSTGTSIFGSSPLAQTQPSAQISPTTNVFGPSPTNGLGEFPTTWGTTTTDVRNDHRGPSPNAGWASNWPSSTTNNGAKAAPINPFTGNKKKMNVFSDGTGRCEILRLQFFEIVGSFSVGWVGIGLKRS